MQDGYIDLFALNTQFAGGTQLYRNMLGAQGREFFTKMSIPALSGFQVSSDKPTQFSFGDIDGDSRLDMCARRCDLRRRIRPRAPSNPLWRSIGVAGMSTGGMLQRA